MTKGATIGLVVGIGALGLGAFILLRKPTAERPDPLANILGAAPGAIEGAGNVVVAGQNTVSKVIKSTVNLATTPARTVIGAGASAVKSGVSALKSIIPGW